MHLPKHDLKSLNEATVFLLQAWCELFAHDTPDTCQPRIFHTGHLVSELRAVAEQAIETRKFLKHFEAVRLELQTSIEKETAFLGRLPQYNWLLRELANEQDPAKALVQARILEGKVSEYESTSVLALREAVAELPAKKDKAFETLTRFASVVIRSGRTPRECLDFVTDCYWQASPQEVVEGLIAFSSPSPQMFDCYFLLKGAEPDCFGALQAVGFSVDANADTLSEPPRQLASDEVYLVTRQESSVPGVAVQQAASRLRRVIDVFNFHHNSPRLRIETTAFARTPTGNQWQIPLSDVALRRLHPRKNAARLTQELVSNPTALNQLSDRILNALEHASLAQASANPRVQLVSMWAALECLAGPQDSRSILDHVVDAILPIVILQRSEKTVRYLGIALRSLWIRQPDQILGSGFPNSRKFIYPEELLITLCKPEKHPDITALLSFAATNPLLCNRLFTTWKLFSSPQNLARKLSSARRTMEWHFARIYRARNLIVHQGVEMPHLPWLLDHLHYYFAAACGRVLDALKANPSWGIDEALASWKSKSDYLVHGLEKHPDKLRVGDIIRAPEILGDNCPWSHL